MDEETPVKRRKTENLNDISPQDKVTKQWFGNVEISALSVKPDKFQKLRRIVRTSCEKTQTRSDDVVISSVGSSPSSSPRLEGLTALSSPVDPTELRARLTVLVREEDKENRSSKSSDGNLQPENKVQFATEKGVKISEGKHSEGHGSDDTKSKNVVPDKNMNIPMDADEFYALLRKLVNEKMKKLEESYRETICPLEEKIVLLQNENEILQNHAKQLQEYLKKVLAEYKKQQEKPAQSHVGVQAGSSEPPPPLTPMQTTVDQTLASKPAPVVHIIDSGPGIYKPPSITLPHATQVSTLTATNIAHSVQVATSVVNGIRQPLANTGYVYTSGQPKMYSDAPHKPGSNPNAVVAQRPHSTFVRPSGPVTATVYPQPQNLPTSPSVHRSSPSTPRNPSPPVRFPYNPQTPNGIMLRTHAQPVTHMTAQYTVAHERKDNSTGTPVGTPVAARHMSASPQGHPLSYSGAPPRHQGPPPSYSVAAARPQQQVSYHPSAAAAPAQVNGVRQTHYAVRQAAPAPAVVQTQGPHPHPAGPPPLVRAQPNIHQQQQQRTQVMQNISPRYQGPQQTHVMRQRPPYPQNTPTQVVNDPRTQAAAVPPRHHGQVPTVPPLPSQASPSQANGIVRDLPPPVPTVSISGASNGIVLSWNMNIPEGCAPIDSYQLFAYQNNGHVANTPSLWKKLGIVKALPLPMACTLTQFVSGSMYYFAVRAIDIKGRAGNYSAPCAITLPSESDKGRS